MNIVFGVLIGLFVLMFLVIAHEFGHFIAARKSGVKVNEFGIGFPPAAIKWVKDPKTKKWKKLKKEDWDKPQETTILSLNWLPIGGFCAMDGESDADTKKGTFGAATFWQKTKILFAGVAMNWLVAFVILTILALTGMPQFIENQFHLDSDAVYTSEPVEIAQVEENSPASAAGFESGDKILKIDGQEMATGTEIIAYNTAHAGETLTYTIEHPTSCDAAPCPTEEKDLTVTLNSSDADYLLGVTMSSSQTLIRSTWSAPIVGAATTVQLTGETFRGLGEMLWNLCSGLVSQISFDDSVREQGREAIGAAGDSVSGPVGIIGTIFPAFASSGPTNLAFLAALISVALACMNVLPIPALDGGRWLLIAIYKLRKKPLTKETEEKIVGRAFVVLLVLIALITVLDITKFF